MERRTFSNPAINDSATFIKTSEETGGAFTLVEIDLGKSDGPPLHYHNAFSEKFEVKKGVLYLQTGKEKIKLNVGESATVPAGTPHRFYNEGETIVKFDITIQRVMPAEWWRQYPRPELQNYHYDNRNALNRLFQRCGG